MLNTTSPSTQAKAGSLAVISAFLMGAAYGADQKRLDALMAMAEKATESLFGELELPTTKAEPSTFQVPTPPRNWRAPKEKKESPEEELFSEFEKAGLVLRNAGKCLLLSAIHNLITPDKGEWGRGRRQAAAFLRTCGYRDYRELRDAVAQAMRTLGNSNDLSKGHYLYLVRENDELRVEYDCPVALGGKVISRSIRLQGEDLDRLDEEIKDELRTDEVSDFKVGTLLPLAR